MKLLTLTPDGRAYVIALVSVSALACAPGAELVRAVWPARRRPAFVPVYVGTLTAVAALAVATLRLPSMSERSGAALVSSLLLGLVAGIAASWCDGSIRRAIRGRRRRAEAVDGRRPRPLVPLGAAGQQFPPPGIETGTAEFGASSLGALIAIATLEEILFRGVVVDLSRELSVELAVVCIAASLLVFAGSHAYWGWEEVIAKLPLGVAALVVSLPFRTVVGAVAAHIVFNARSWLAAKPTEPTTMERA
jgi:membrane protease YdiL (CAAX protease family)